MRIDSVTPGDVASGILLVLGLILLYTIMIGLVVLAYVLTAKAMYKISKRRNIPNPWMAWVPGLNIWNMGEVANEYDSRLGMKRKWNLVMVIMYGAYTVIYSVFSAFHSVLVFSIGLNSSYYDAFEFMADESTVILILIVLILILSMVIVVAASIVQMICLFKIFESTVPDKAVKYLILSLLVPLAYAVCLSKCADKGYPFPFVPPEAEVSCAANE